VENWLIFECSWLFVYELCGTLWVLLKRSTSIRLRSKIQPRSSYIYFK
jgi:hypothetical protein